MADSAPPPPSAPENPVKYCGTCGQSLDLATSVCPRCGAQQAYLDPRPASIPATPSGARTAPHETNGMAIASLVLGILWLYWLGSILAIVFGHVALAQIRRSNGDSGGRGMAIAGLILGYVGIGVAILILVLVLSMPFLFHGYLPGRDIVV